MSSSGAALLDLPKDLANNVLSYLDARSLARTAAANKQLQSSASSPALWFPLVSLQQASQQVTDAKLERNWKAFFAESAQSERKRSQAASHWTRLLGPFWCPLIVFTIFLVIAGVYCFGQVSRFERYEPVPATIVMTGIRVNEGDDDNDPTFEPYVEYQYEHSGELWLASNALPSLSHDSFAHRGDAELALGTATAGLPITVYVDPASPTAAFRLREATAEPVVCMLLALVAFAAFVVFGLLGVQRHKTVSVPAEHRVFEPTLGCWLYHVSDSRRVTPRTHLAVLLATLTLFHALGSSALLWYLCLVPAGAYHTDDGLPSAAVQLVGAVFELAGLLLLAAVLRSWLRARTLLGVSLFILDRAALRKSQDNALLIRIELRRPANSRASTPVPDLSVQLRLQSYRITEVRDNNDRTSTRTDCIGDQAFPVQFVRSAPARLPLAPPDDNSNSGGSSGSNGGGVALPPVLRAQLQAQQLRHRVAWTAGMRARTRRQQNKEAEAETGAGLGAAAGAAAAAAADRDDQDDEASTPAPAAEQVAAGDAKREAAAVSAGLDGQASETESGPIKLFDGSVALGYCSVRVPASFPVTRLRDPEGRSLPRGAMPAHNTFLTLQIAPIAASSSAAAASAAGSESWWSRLLLRCCSCAVSLPPTTLAVTLVE